MKAILFLTAATSLLLAGCGEKSNPSAPTTNAATGGNPLTAPVDYLDAAAKAKQSAVKTVDVTSLNKAIEMFNVDNGRFPKDLDELVAEKYMPKIPAAPYGTRLEYDATAGKVKVVKQ
jgi:hypothetical protein